MNYFAAIPIPNTIGDRVVPLQKGVPGARWRPQDNFHITLAYFGALAPERVELLDDYLDKIRVAPFDLHLTGAGAFGGDTPHALWLGVDAPGSLFQLQSQIERTARHCQIDMESRKYLPHLTLAYLGRPIDRVRIAKFLSRLGDYVSDSFIADRFYLYSSQPQSRGPNIYETEAEYPLIPPRI